VGTRAHGERQLSGLAIDARGLSREFVREGTRLTAVDHIDLQLPRGAIFGFLGPNGAGKTTTIRLLLGLLEPTSGSVDVLGFDVRTQAAQIRERCGALLERDGLYDRLTAYENLQFFARAWHLPKEVRSARIRELLEHFGLWNRRNDPAGTWSRGMRQKLAIARALLHRPELVFLDEPTAGLDPAAAAALRDDLRALVRTEAVTVFLTTHNLAEAERVCDRIGILHSGKLRAVGTIDQLRSAAGSSIVNITGAGFTADRLAAVERATRVQIVEAHETALRATLPEPATAAPLVRALIEQGCDIEEVRRDTPTLEQLYLSLIGDTDAASAARGSADNRVHRGEEGL